jgi:hypothetical protein
MKKVIIPKSPSAEIDWSKPQWVIGPAGEVVLISGIDKSTGMFDGTVLPCDKYPNGDYRTDWIKSSFKLLTYDIPFTISNSED